MFLYGGFQYMYISTAYNLAYIEIFCLAMAAEQIID